MQPSPTPSTQSTPKLAPPKRGFALGRGAMALLLATPLLIAVELPAQANFATTVRGIFTGNTGQGARGNARGAAIRDRRCGTTVPMVNSSENSGESGAAVSPMSPASSPEPLILLVPNTGQTFPITTVPEVLVYIPPHTATSADPASTTSPDPLPLQTKIDLDDIDSVVDENLQGEVERAQQSELLLELQFNGTNRYYSLPDEGLIAKLQAPESTTFAIGEVSAIEVRLVCRRVDLTSLRQTAATESSYVTESEVFADVQRVEASPKLTAALATLGADERYQAYLDNGLWFEMVAALAANPQSEEWAALLQELDIPSVNLTPQTLTPITN